MIFTIVIPTLFILTSMVGLGFLFNGISGLTIKKAFAPVDSGSNSTEFSLISGSEAAKFSKLCLTVGLIFLLVSGTGLFQTHQFMNSPAAIKYIFPPPDGNIILYSTVNNGMYEITYLFDRDIKTIHAIYYQQVENKGWTTVKNTPLTLVATKPPHQISLTFIGNQVGDKKNYKSKVIFNHLTNQ